MLHDPQFYDELSIEKLLKAFKTYAKNYRIELIHSKDPSVQSKAIKSSIKNLFKDLLDEIKPFKYQITVKVLLRIHREYGEIEFASVYFNCNTKTVEFAPVYFNSTTNTVNNSKYDLDKYFQMLCRIDIFGLMKDLVD